MRAMILVNCGVRHSIRHHNREVVMWHVTGVAVCSLILVTGHVRAADAPADASAASLGEAVRSGKPILNLRPRYEFVDQDGRPDQANAFTLRTLAGWKTGTWKGLSGTIELIGG